MIHLCDDDVMLIVLLLLLLCVQANYSHGFHFHDIMGHLVYYELVSSFVPPNAALTLNIMYVLCSFYNLTLNSNRNTVSLLCQQPGMLHLDALRDAGITKDMLLRHFTYCMEWCWKYAAPLEVEWIFI